MKKAISRRTFLVAVVVTTLLTGSCEGESVVDTNTKSAAIESEAAPQIKPAIEKCDYDGEKFTIYAPVWGLYENYFFADGQTGDIMNDVIVERERLTEEYLGINIEYILDGTIDDVQNNVKSCVMSGDDTYQLILTHCISGVGSMITEGLLYNWNDLEYADLSMPYWNQNANEYLSLGDSQYYAVSDYMLADPNCILFNKNMVEEYKLENPYEIVLDGKWTVDKLLEMSSLVTNDINGDSVYDYNDMYGFSAAANWMLASFYQASDIYLVGKTGDGELKLSFYGERTVELISKLDKLFNRTNDAFTYESDTSEEKIVKIESGRVLFQPESLNNMFKYRDCDIEYGIIPYPKYDEFQEEYYSNDWSGLMCILTTVGNPELVGKTCEMLAYYSGYTTIPAYYELVLGEKLSRDEDSKKMLDIIYGNVVYDPGIYFFGWGKMQMLYHSIKTLVVLQNSSDISSFYNTNKVAAEAEIESFLSGLPKK